MSLSMQNDVISHFIKKHNAAALLHSYYEDLDEQQKQEFVVALIGYVVMLEQLQTL